MPSDLPELPDESVSNPEDVARYLKQAIVSRLGVAGDLSDALAKGSKVAGDYIGGKLGFQPSPEVAAPLLPTQAVINALMGRR